MFLYQGVPVELEFREYRFDESFPFIALLDGQFTFPKPSPTLSFLHFHNCMEIGICRSGSQTLYVEQRRMTFQAGDLCIIPPYAMHITQQEAGCGEGADCEYLYFIPELLLKELYPEQFPPEMLWYKYMDYENIFHSSDCPEIWSILQNVLTEAKNASSGYTYAVRGLLQMFLIQMGRILSPGRQEDTTGYYRRSSLFPAIQYIGQNYAGRILVRDLAQMCGMTPSAFSRSFQTLFRQTPASYLRMVRLQHACDLLYSTEKSILDISLESGFASVSNFNRSFLEQYQRTPRQWRNAKRSVQKKDLKHSLFTV